MWNSIMRILAPKLVQMFIDPVKLFPLRGLGTFGSLRGPGPHGRWSSSAGHQCGQKVK
jgi:hypothetical protein